MDFQRSMELLVKHGYQGVEIAPFTVFGDFSPLAVSSGLRVVKKALSDTGIRFAGLHWLFVKPEGLHVTSPDPDLRRRSWDHLRLLLDISGELGGGMLIFGSPKQRSSRGTSTAEALNHYREGLAETADYAWERKSRVLVESLASRDTDIVNTLEEAARIVRSVDKPGLGSMFDFHNTVDETEAWDVLLDRHWDMIHHIHVNEMDGSHPGRGPSDFRPAFSLLHSRGFEGWVSLEIFSVPEDPEIVLRETMDFFRKHGELTPQGRGRDKSRKRRNT